MPTLFLKPLPPQHNTILFTSLSTVDPSLQCNNSIKTTTFYSLHIPTQQVACHTLCAAMLLNKEASGEEKTWPLESQISTLPSCITLKLFWLQFSQLQKVWFLTSRLGCGDELISELIHVKSAQNGAYYLTGKLVMVTKKTGFLNPFCLAQLPLMQNYQYNYKLKLPRQNFLVLCPSLFLIVKHECYIQVRKPLELRFDYYDNVIRPARLKQSPSLYCFYTRAKWMVCIMIK